MASGSLIRLLAALFLMSSVLVIGAAGILASITDSGQDLVKLRNALIYKVSNADAWKWHPDAVPTTFRWESKEPPIEFDSVVDVLLLSSRGTEFEKTIALAHHLVSAPNRSGGAIQRDSRQTYEKIIEDGTGYCSDYTLALTALALSADVPIREWGISFDGFGGDGHAFNEIYDRTLGKWVFIDSFNSFYIEDANGVPLSVAEFRQHLINGYTASMQVVTIDPSAFPFRSGTDAIEYYRRGSDSFFMIWGNDIFTYENNPVVRAMSHISRAAEQGAAIMLGIHPPIVILGTSTNRDEILQG